jgi:hypothetical protein
MKKWFSIVAMMILVLIVVTPAFSGEKIVEAEGFSSSSKSDAIRQAQRMAVEEAVGVFIKSETEVENFVLKKDKIFSRTEGYVTRYDLLSDKKEGDDFVVLIRATVSLDKIKDDLMAMKILLESIERPKLIVFVEEEYKSMDDLGMGIAGIELSARLAAKGFDIVDRAQLESVKNRDQARQALAGNETAAASLGLNFGAQYVVFGKAVAQDAGEAFEGSGLRSIQASLQLKVIQSQTGSVLGSVVKNGVSAHMSPLTGATIAFQKTVKKAVDEYLVDTITNSFQDFLNNGAPMKLHVTGVKTFKEYKRVSKSIEALIRVASSKKEGWNKAGGLLVLDLRFKGTSEELAELLDGRQLEKNTLEVVDFASERVDCHFQ